MKLDALYFSRNYRFSCVISTSTHDMAKYFGHIARRSADGIGKTIIIRTDKIEGIWPRGWTLKRCRWCDRECDSAGECRTPPGQMQTEVEKGCGRCTCARSRPWQWGTDEEAIILGVKRPLRNPMTRYCHPIETILFLYVWEPDSWGDNEIKVIFLITYFYGTYILNEHYIFSLIYKQMRRFEIPKLQWISLCNCSAHKRTHDLV